MHLVTTQQAGFQLELFSMPIHRELTLDLFWEQLPARALRLLNQQSPVIKGRAMELLNRHFTACLNADIAPHKDSESAVVEAIDEAKLEVKDPNAAAWYEPIPQDVFDSFVRSYDVYKSPLRDAA